ncbi:acyl-CoA dehydrogenase family protein [Acidiferrimicrobium sp. IK]|uniref:acyl-CoA dehydrogenase family protein n=1 Tax=Acidiferrimicrobium sp. IK TaxID=2871700 RepID=UPI0021CAE530|nr:acyl-CoA dehydrogenase family protein [Acidiferrimicrobium sp. IK]MCU4184167.1 acyl-CoA dehydrogenase family protein [Acidiferrimicrobium sp. IK]
MDPRYDTGAEDYRHRIRAFLHDHLPPGWQGIGALGADEAAAFSAEWRKTLHDHGLLAAAWPKEYGGGGMTAVEQVVLVEELVRAGAPGGNANDVFSIGMVGNTLLAWGTEEQKRHYLPRILSGEDVWCQGYSEPGSGSDLASLRCRAELHDGEWIINGQKIWTSAAHLANMIFVLARTDGEQRRHRGITFLLVPLDQPGVEIRPIRMMTGSSDFNETFFTDARTAEGNVVGAVGEGWAVAMTLLGYERGEAAATMPIVFRDELDRLSALARDRGANTDPGIRQRLARSYARVEVMRYLGLRTLTGFLAGSAPGPESSVFKVFWSEHHQEVTELAVDILGPDALVPSGRWPANAFQSDDVGAPNSSASWVGTFFNARAGTIYAGTSQIQRNIIGEMVLGLPKEPAARS